jgi:tetratricopeptide (TPR) repeat protein
MLQIVPESPEGLVALGSLLADHGRFSEARDIFERAWNDYGELVALVRLGDVALGLNQPELALTWSRKLHQRAPQSASAYTVAAAALLRLGQLDAAREELIHGASEQPGNPEILLRLSELLIKQKRFAQARKALSDMRPRSAVESAQIHRLISLTFSSEGRLSEAALEMEAARDADPKDPQLTFQLADLLAQAGRYNQAIAALQAASELPRELQSAVSERILKLEARQSTERTRMIFERAISTSSTLAADGGMW